MWRRKWLLLAIVVLIPAAVYAASTLLPKTYQSSATINVQATASASSAFSNTTSKSNIGEVQTLIETPVVARGAARFLGLPPSDARMLLGHISVVPTNPAENDSNFLTITAQDSDAAMAARIANAFARAVGQARTAAAITDINQTIRTLERQEKTEGSEESTRATLSLQIQQLRALRATQKGTTTIVEAAVPASTPISPRPKRNTAIALILALLVAGGLAPMLDRLDRRVRESGELEELLEAPVLAVVSDDAFPGHPPNYHVREAFETLRASLTYFNVDRTLSSLVVASPIPQDGKTTVAINLAISYALDERDVILIDADMRRPQVAARLGRQASVGLESVLVGERTLDEALAYVDVGAGRLRILPAAVPPPNPAVLIGSQRMRMLIAELTEQVEMVVIDTPGLLACSDAIPLFNQVTGSVIVARLDRTPRDVVRRTKQVIESAGGSVLGSVATGAHTGGIYGYYSYYGYYGGDNGVNGAPPEAGSGLGRLRNLAPGGLRRSRD